MHDEWESACPVAQAKRKEVHEFSVYDLPLNKIVHKQPGKSN